MNAILSPQRGTGFVLDGESVVATITPDRVEKIDGSASAVCSWLRNAEDVLFVEDCTVEQAQKQLSRDVDFERGFRLLLPLFDNSLSETLRVGVAKELELLFTKWGYLANWLGARFYHAPFPSVNRLEESIQISRLAATVHLRGFLLALWKRQSLIREVWMAWNEIPERYFESILFQKDLRQRFADEGVFFRLVDTLAQEDSLSKFIHDEEKSWRQEGVSNFTGILKQLTQPFYEKLLQKHMEQVELTRFRSEIDSLKGAILDSVSAGIFERVAEETSRLVSIQLEFGRPSHVAMSLCDLAGRAKEMGSPKMQFYFAELATKINPWEHRCWRHLADAHKGLGHFESALVMYEDVLSEERRNLVAKHGRAEVLRDLNRLDESLNAYESSIREHPQDVFAKNGRAEVLRDLNRLDEALAAYETAIRDHPQEVVSKCGRAEVLRQLNFMDEALVSYNLVIRDHPQCAVAKNGRAGVFRDRNQLNEALIAYEIAASEHPQDIFAKNGRAEVLRDLNRLDEALAAYEMTIRDHPQAIVPKCGRAEVLRDLNQLSGALTAYDLVIRDHPYDVVAKHGRAEVLRDLNRLDEALSTYGAAIRENSQDVVAKSGRAEVLRDLNRLDEALAEYDIIIRDHPQNIVAKDGRAEVLRDLNRLDDALSAYETVIREHPQDVVAKNGRAEVLRDLNRFDEALAAYDMIIRDHPQSIVAKDGRAEVLRDLNRLDEALAAYEMTICTHPQSIVAKTGRAEVLRDLKRLNDALAAYEVACREHPQSTVAKNGWANLLGYMGRYTEALELLPKEDPKSRQDWVDFHTRGKIFLQMGNLSDAAEIFRRGTKVLLPRHIAAYFQTAFAFYHLRINIPQKAVEVMSLSAGARLKKIQHMIRSHAFGALGMKEECQFELESLRCLSLPTIASTVDEIDARYIQGNPRHPEAWLFRQEQEILLAA